MHTFEVRFVGTQRQGSDNRFENADLLLGAWRMNGQIVGREHPTFVTGRTYVAIVMVQEITSLEVANSGEYVRGRLNELAQSGISVEFRHRGATHGKTLICRCTPSPWMVLCTTFVQLGSPLLCGGCGCIVPLYRYPEPSGDHYKAICSESDYQACDTLQMNCSTGERFGTAEISRLDSSLSIRGRAICTTYAELSGIPVYYYLYRGNGRSLVTERRRTCPGCGGSWLLPERLAPHFDMKCDDCRLVSNIAWTLAR